MQFYYSKHYFPFILLGLLYVCLRLDAKTYGEHSLPHDPTCFTQGLVVKDNLVWESCGLYGKSRIINWNLTTGKVINEKPVEAKYFAEGLTELNGKLYMLTWQSQIAFEINPDTLETTKEFHYEGQGWGLTTDGKSLIMSNGSNALQFINPKDFSVEKTILVNLDGTPVYYLNELEWIDGKIWANVFQSDYIVVINPTTGKIFQRFTLPYLLKNKNIKKPGVLNGIAKDIKTNKIWVTGKNWPLIFEM